MAAVTLEKCPTSRSSASTTCTTPKWAEGYVTTTKARPIQIAAAAPRTVAYVTRWAWRASPRLTVLSAVLQLAAGVVTAFGLLATADVFTRLLQAGPTPERIVAAVPAIVVVVVALCVRALLDAAVAGTQGALAPRVEQIAQDALHQAVLAVDLEAFDDADFAELIERGAHQGPSRVRAAVIDSGDLIAAIVSALAAVVTAAVLHPLLAPAVLLAAIPQGWASVRSARLMFASVVRMNSRYRRQNVTGELIMRRDPAAEVRAFTTQEVLLGEHRRIADGLTAESVRLSRDRTVVQLVGRALGGVGAGLAYALLAVLLYGEVLPLALAGTAAVAMRTASQSASRMIFEANSLFESSFFIGLLRSGIRDAAGRSRPHGRAPQPSGPETITLVGATFRYPGQDVPAVDGIDVTLRRGETVALVGENGSGKSTLAKLITGLYLPSAGRVEWDGVDTRGAGRAGDARAGRGRAAGSAALADDRGRQRADRPHHHRRRRGRAAARGRRPLGRRRGRRGAARRLVHGAVAGVPGRAGPVRRPVAAHRGGPRAVPRRPVVIADEPTAALDARAEHAVFETLRGLAAASPGTAGRITVLVTHRLANVRHADQILVLEKGKLIEQGRHAELMALGASTRSCSACRRVHTATSRFTG